MIKQIKFISIPVADQNRALDFYTDKLGFTIITDQPFDEKQRWIELRIPKAETRVVLFTPEGDEKRIGSFMNMSYTCDDIDKTYAELRKRGVEFEGPPQKQPWAPMRCSRTVKAIGSLFHRNERVVSSGQITQIRSHCS
jgi:catechol 2,3-dioxygenase-like lactoylglutathione lyase family enzyme